MRISRVQRWLILIGLMVTVAISIISTSGFLQAAPADTTIPAVAKACIPNQNVPSRVLAKGQNAGKTYYLIGVNDSPKSHADMYDALIEVTGNQCKELLGSPRQAARSLNAVIPVEFAKQLQLQRYRLWVKELGKDKFQQLLNRSLSQPSSSQLTPDVRWALQQLGLQIPR